MDENGKKWRKYQADKIHQINAPVPPNLDFEALAKQFGLTAGRTGLISNSEVKKFDIGSSVAMEGISPFSIAAFKPSLTSYKPEIAQDIEGNYYLFWKSDDVAESAPSLDDKNVREEGFTPGSSSRPGTWPANMPNSWPKRPPKQAYA